MQLWSITDSQSTFFYRFSEVNIFTKKTPIHHKRIDV